MKKEKNFKKQIKWREKEKGDPLNKKVLCDNNLRVLPSSSVLQKIGFE